MGWVAKTFAGIGIAIAFLLVFGAVVAYTALQEAKPVIEREYPTALFDSERACDPCTETATEVFRVEAHMNKVNAQFHVAMEVAGGALRISVTDPSGDIRYDRTFSGGPESKTESDSPIWTPEVGEWRVTRAFTTYRGSIDLSIWASGIPPGSL